MRLLKARPAHGALRQRTAPQHLLGAFLGALEKLKAAALVQGLADEKEDRDVGRRVRVPAVDGFVLVGLNFGPGGGRRRQEGRAVVRGRPAKVGIKVPHRVAVAARALPLSTPTALLPRRLSPCSSGHTENSGKERGGQPAQSRGGRATCGAGGAVLPAARTYLRLT